MFSFDLPDVAFVSAVLYVIAESFKHSASGSNVTAVEHLKIKDETLSIMKTY